MKSEPQIAVMDGGRMRVLQTSTYENALREAMMLFLDARRSSSGHEMLRTSVAKDVLNVMWRENSPGYVIIPAHEMKDHLLLMSGGNVCKYAMQDRWPHESALEDWMHFLRLMPDLPGKLSERATELSEERIQSLLDVMLDVDPFEPVEARIDGKNAEMRAEFLKEFPVLDSAGVHKLAGLKGTNTSQTVNTWRKKGRILGLPVQGKNAYPVFQFDADGQPFRLMEKVLAALPVSFTPWQRAFWFVSPKEDLDAQTPAEAVREGDHRVVETAHSAGELVAG